MQTNWNVAASLRIMSALVPFISLWHATSFLFLSLSLSLSLSHLQHVKTTFA